MKLTAELIHASPWIPITPTFKQLAFIALPHRMAFYGGAAGGGKSEALLAAAALYCTVPGYRAMLFRRSLQDLQLKGALMDRAIEWWARGAARWVGKHNRWEFPTGPNKDPATVGFGYVDNPMDHLRYKSMEVQYIGIDEATDVREEHNRYLITRLRKLVGNPIPTRMRYAGNPGGESHLYFGEHFVQPEHEHPLRPFIPATLEDNPHANRRDYELSLAEQDDVGYAQLRHGAWIQDERTTFFKRSWWLGKNRYNPTDPARARLAIARFAALDTAEKKDESNAYTALVVGELTRDWRLQIVYAARERLTFDELPDWVSEQLLPWAYDGKLGEVFVEDASSGTQLLQVTEASDSWLSAVMLGVKPELSDGRLGGKAVRWRHGALWCRRDCVLLPEPHDAVPWLYPLEAELYNVPNTKFKDYADAHSILITEVEDREEHPLSTGWRYREARRVRAAQVEAGVERLHTNGGRR